MTTLLLAGGGTGGHVFPMVAVGEAVERLQPGAEVVYVGTAKGLEARILPGLGARLELMDVAPLRGQSVLASVRAVGRAAGAVHEASRLLDRVRPDVVLSAGGYAAGPVSLAARLRGIPVAVLEPNSILGLANRLLAPFAARAYLSFPEVERYFRPSVILRAGVPLRRAFARCELPAPTGKTRLLVLGGSQGAQAINEAMPEAIAALAASGIAVDCLHQTGAGNDEAVRKRYAELGLAHVRVSPFVDRMFESIAEAELIVGRAGASTLAEICAVGRASILLPYPFAAGDHQRQNAESLARAGAAIAIPQSEAPARLAQELGALVRDRVLLTEMARRAAERGRPDSADVIAEDLLALAQGKQGKARDVRTADGRSPKSEPPARCVSSLTRETI